MEPEELTSGRPPGPTHFHTNYEWKSIISSAMMEPEIKGSIFCPGLSPLPVHHFTTWIGPEPGV